MSNALVRGLGGPGAVGSPLGKRGAHVLSDGSWASVVGDGNVSGVTGATGDGSNIAKLYIYRSTDEGLTWTLRATLSTAIPTFVQYSSSVDSSDNIYIVWIDTSTTVKWVKATNAAFAYTFGTSTVIYTAVSSFNPHRVDIDCFANGQCVVAVGTSCTSGSGSAIGIKAYVLVLSAAGAVVYTKVAQILSGISPKGSSEDITVSATHDAIPVSNIGSWVAIAARQPASGTDLGDWIGYGSVNISTGVEQSFAEAVVPMSGKSFRRYMLFCSDGSRGMIYGTISSGTGAVFGYRRFTVGAAGAGMSISVSSLLTYPTQTRCAPDLPSDNGAYYTATMQYSGDTLGVMTWGYSTNLNPATTSTTSYPYTWTVTVTAKTLQGTFRNEPLPLDDGQTISTGALACMSGGSNRNFIAGKIGFLIHYTNRVYQARFLVPSVQYAPTFIVPANAAALQTGLPSYSLDVKQQYTLPGSGVEAYFKLGKDSGLTVGVVTILDPTTYISKSANSIKYTIAYSPKSLTYELTTGTWYIQGFTYDEYGRFSPGSTVTSFSILHPPAPTGLSPTGGAISSYGTGTIYFSWNFTDPYINDSQSAYQLQIADSALNSIFDSGKVLSSARSVGVVLAATYKDVGLNWRILLYDKDGQVGSFSSWQVFSVSDGPNVVITSPVDNATVTNGVLTISWTNGINSPKTQASYSVVVTDSVTGASIYNTGSQNSTATSLVLPTGILHTGNSYTIKVTSVDSNGQSASSPISHFVTSWTPPAAADIVRAYFGRYETDGYIFIGWSDKNINLNFIQWNIWRRGLGEANWILLKSITDIQSSYGYRDYDVRAGYIYDYAVTQVITSLGDLVESVIAVQAEITVPSTYYWLIDPFGIHFSVPLYAVTADSYTEEQETAVYTIIGAGRHVDEGDKLGKSGVLSVELWDKAVGLVRSVNSFLNPSFQAAVAVNSPDNWTISATGSYGVLSSDYVTFYETAPNGVLENFIIRVSAFGNATTDAITIAQSVPVNRLPVAPGWTFSHSDWFTVEQETGNKLSISSVKSTVSYYNFSGALISTEVIVATQSEQYEPANNGDINTGSWKRYSSIHSMPLLTDHMVVTTSVYATSLVAPFGLITGGSQLEPLTTPYFDGDSRGANWLNSEYTSASFTSGYYKASSQLEDLLEMKNLGRPVILKTPFGQSLFVKIGAGSGASGPTFQRLAGTSAEFGSLSLSYMEVIY